MLVGLDLLLVFLSVVVGAAIVGTVGFGLALTTAPVMLHFLAPQQVVVVNNCLMIVMNSLVLWQTRRHFAWRRAWGLALGGMLAVPLGVTILNTASPRSLRLLITAGIMALALLTLFRIRLPFTRWRFAAILFGFATIMLSTTVGTGGPLVAVHVLDQEWPRQVARATLAFFSLVCYLAAASLYAATGLLTWDRLGNVGLLLPALLAGLAAATLVGRRLNERVFRYVVVTVIVLSGLVLLARELLQWR